MRSEDEIIDLIEKLKKTQLDISPKGGAMLITDAIEMSIINLKWVLQDVNQ